MKEPVWVWGLPLSALTLSDAAEAVMTRVEAGEPSFVVTANTNYAMLTEREPRLRSVNALASFIVADGAPLVWASRLAGTPLPERVAGSDLIFAVCEKAARRGYSAYFLGGAEGVAEEASRRLAALYPGLRVVGTDSPPHRPLSSEENEAVLGKVRAARPDILFVALGQPKGEFWLADHYQRMGAPVSIQVGATLDFVAGRFRRAPGLVQKAGMEWAFRLCLEPVRLSPRYARNARFVLARAAEGVARRARRKPSSNLGARVAR